MTTVAGPGCRRPFGRAVRVWLLDERLYLIESEIARLRDLLYTSNQPATLLARTPLHHELDRLVVQHARISLSQMRRAPASRGSKRR